MLSDTPKVSIAMQGLLGKRIMHIACPVMDGGKKDWK